MCRVSLHNAFHHHISSATLFQGLNVMGLDSYHLNRILRRWAGHDARIPMTYDSGAAAVAYWLGSTLKAELMP